MDADRVLEDAGVFIDGFGSGFAGLCRAEIEVSHLHELTKFCPYIYLDVSLLFSQLELVGDVGCGVSQEKDFRIVSIKSDGAMIHPFYLSGDESALVVEAGSYRNAGSVIVVPHSHVGERGVVAWAMLVVSDHLPH